MHQRVPEKRIPVASYGESQVERNFDQFDEKNKPNIDILKGIYDSIRRLAREHDAAAIHLKDLHEYANKRNAVNHPTTFIVKLLAPEVNDIIDGGVPKWNVIGAVLVMPDVAPQTKIFIGTPTDSIRSDGLHFYENTFFTEGAPKGDWCRAIALLPLGARGIHIFILTATESRCEIRHSEFLAILNRIKYDPRIVHEVTKRNAK